MKRIIAILGLLTLQGAHAEVYVKNHTQYPIQVWVTWFALGASAPFCKNGFCTEGGTIFEPNEEGLVKQENGEALQDHAWSKRRYQIKANLSQQPMSSSRDWVNVYDTQKNHWARDKYEAGGYRNLTVFTRQDANGNEVFDIEDSLR